MNILLETLKELRYTVKETFQFSYIINEVENTHNVLPFTSLDFPSQVYLIVNIAPSELSDILTSNFLSRLATKFRKEQFHRSDMDKNTTLLLQCVGEDPSKELHLQKVKIEDDPYYFKKYVFMYSPIEENRANEYLENRRNKTPDSFLFVNEIQNYLSDTEIFSSYKQNHRNQPTYSYLVELATKTPSFPLPASKASEIKSVETFLEEELSGKDINIKALNRLLKLDLDFKEDSLDKIVACWEDSLTE